MGECHQPDRAPSQKSSDHSPPADMKETHGFDNPFLLMNSGKWLMGHPNCILRAGTPDTILFDDEDFYWHLAGTGVEPRVVQVLRGKRLIGELLLEPELITCVEGGQENMTENLFFSSYRRPLGSAAPPISLSFPMATRRVGKPPVQFTDGKKEGSPFSDEGSATEYLVETMLESGSIRVW